MSLLMYENVYLLAGVFEFNHNYVSIIMCMLSQLFIVHWSFTFQCLVSYLVIVL